MQIELPRYIWADTRFKRDVENPLLYRASTKSYDKATHQVAPFNIDVNFAPAGLSPRTARALIAMSEISMLTLPNLLSVVEAGADSSDAEARNTQNLSGYLTEVTGMTRGRLWEAGSMGGILTGSFLGTFLKLGNQNVIDILDLSCVAENGLRIAETFVDFYKDSRGIVMNMADLSLRNNSLDLKAPSYDYARSILYNRSVRVDHIQSGDKGFRQILVRLSSFLGELKLVRPQWFIDSDRDISGGGYAVLWDSYVNEIHLGKEFLMKKETISPHSKFLEHKHTQTMSEGFDSGICGIQTGRQDEYVAASLAYSPVAVIERAGRCPFFVDRGWVEVHRERVPAYAS